MPLSILQTNIFGLLSSHRDPESYVAGGTCLTRHSSRIATDIVIYHDRETRVGPAAAADMAVLRVSGMSVLHERCEAALHRALVSNAGQSTRIEWVAQSNLRFFPIQADPLFGYALHPVDVAINKALAAARRREPRDFVDLVDIHDSILPLGAVVLAAVARVPAATPEGLLADIRHMANYAETEFRDVESETAVDGAAVLRRAGEALAAAEKFVLRMPADAKGLVFLDDGRPIQPDPDRLDRYRCRSARPHGHSH